MWFLEKFTQRVIASCWMIYLSPLLFPTNHFAAKAFEKFSALLCPRCIIFIIQSFSGLQDIKVFQGHLLKYDYKIIQAYKFIYAVIFPCLLCKLEVKYLVRQILESRLQSLVPQGCWAAKTLVCEWALQTHKYICVSLLLSVCPYIHRHSCTYIKCIAMHLYGYIY